MRRCRSILPLLAVAISVCGCSGPDEPAGVPEDVIRENTLGTAYLGQQEWASAADAFRRGLAMREQDPLLLSNLSVALIQDGKPDEAETWLRQAIAIEPNHPHANYNLGLIESNRGNFAEAAAHFELVAAYDPNDVLTQYQLGIAYASLDRSEDAVGALQRALQADPDHVSSLYALGRELVKQGKRDEGRDLIARSQAIRARSGLDTAVGSQYGEQGIYALGADYPGDALAAPDAIELSFASVQRYESSAPPAWALSRNASGDPTVIVAADTGIGRLTRAGGFVESLPPHPGGGAVRSIATGDGDDDGIVELYALVGGAGTPAMLAVIEQSETGQLAWGDPGLVTGAAVIPDGITAADLVLVDREHDGDLDVLACWAASAGAGCAIATNDGAGAFTVRPSADHGFAIDLAAADSVHVTLSDIDNDRDIDLIVAETGAIHVLANQRDGNFLARSYDDLGVTKLTDLTLADIDKDGWMDAVVAGDGGLQLIPNRRGQFGDPQSLAGVSAPLASITILDADNDGFLDLAIGAEDGRAKMFRNLGTGQWIEVTEWIADPSATPVAALDVDADGDLDLISVTANGAALMENSGGNAQRWITVESHGVGDNRFGVGARVEVLAGALRQKFEVTGPLPVHAGLGRREQVDSVRHLWPSGVLQDEVQLASGTDIEVKQLDRKGTSCPILYVWSDGEWRFVTDFLGGSAVGYQAAPGVFSNPDTDEYVKLDSSPTADAEGNLRLRVNNQLQEIIWYDKLELIAVDHPIGTELFPNERLMPGPPWPDFTLFISGDVRPIVSVRDVDDETDWTEVMADADRRYVENFENLRFKGYANTHTLEFDLGAAGDDERVVLLLDGWIDYADSTANVGAAQAGLSLMPPVLTVADGHGGWLDTGHLMGFPAGLPKTMAVDLTGLFPSDDHRIRIATNMRIYWDRARVMIGGDNIDYRAHRIAPVSADLRYGGFPREASRDDRQPFGYDPASVDSTSPWKAHVGRYTAFGDVTTLIDDIDDRLVMTRAGDEIELVFRAPSAVPEGHTRTFLLFADGFGKDMDPNSAANYLAGPMPFHGMPTYPYPLDVVPPVDLSGTLTRAVIGSARDPAGAVPLPLAPLRGAR